MSAVARSSEGPRPETRRARLGIPPKKATPVSGGRRRFRLQASLSGLGSEDRQKRSLILNPPKASSRQCPLPSRASSIDLEHSESFMKPDHATSDSMSAGLACSLRGPVRSLSLFYTHHGWGSQVLPEMGSGQFHDASLAGRVERDS